MSRNGRAFELLPFEPIEVPNPMAGEEVYDRELGRYITAPPIKRISSIELYERNEEKVDWQKVLEELIEEGADTRSVVPETKVFEKWEQALPLKMREPKKQAIYDIKIGVPKKVAETKPQAQMLLFSTGV